jgi:hypothetical protein
MAPQSSFAPSLNWLNFRRRLSSDTAQMAAFVGRTHSSLYHYFSIRSDSNTTQMTGSIVEIAAYNAKEENEDISLHAKVDRTLGISLISKTKAQSTGHPLVACQTPVEATNSAGQLYQATSYTTLRWFVRDGDPKSYEECFYVVDGGLDADAILGASALQ